MVKMINFELVGFTTTKIKIIIIMKNNNKRAVKIFPSLTIFISYWGQNGYTRIL